MREHKYRAWIPELNDWADDIEVYHDGSFNLGKEKPEGLVSSYDGILMPYTGFKDKNGKEIYEADIYLDFFGNPKVVEFEVSSTRAAVDHGIAAEFIEGRYIIPKNIEIIGNIHENPELAPKG